MSARQDHRTRQQGNILVYILIAIFLTGILVTSMTQGVRKSASSEQVDEVMLYMQQDIQTVQSNITECVTTYSTTSTTDPTTPFPLYSDGVSYGGAGNVLATITCPGAPAGQQTIFTDSISQSLKLLQDTANYTTTYFNNATEGVYLRIARAVSDPAWSEAITRLNNKYSACSVAYIAPGGTDPTGYSGCTYGCLYYWILRRPTSSSSWKAGCP